ncbi:MAG: hypothetical protein IJT50_09300 [Lentisphaeria bacterium]|nr:hypothetical protein [Lentisphaeria bacterium]
MKKRVRKEEKKPIFPVREVDRQLHEACRELNIGHIRAAIEAGADVNAPDETHEYSPLDIVVASLNGWDDYRFNPDYQRQIRTIVELLLLHGADANGIGIGERPLDVFAWSCCDPRICARLLEYGAKVNFECCEQRSVLDLVGDEMTFLSVTEGSEEVLQRLDKIYDILERHGGKSFSDPGFRDAYKQ